MLAIAGAGSLPVIHAAPQRDQGRAARTAASEPVPRQQFLPRPDGRAPRRVVRGPAPGPARDEARRGRKHDPDDVDVAGYVSHLERRHDEALARAGGRKEYDYRYTLNGFAAELSDAQADVLR